MDRETIQLRDYHKALVGLELKFAQDLHKSLAEPDETLPIIIRVLRRDGRNCIGTRDYNPDRVNVAVENGIIKSIISIG